MQNKQGLAEGPYVSGWRKCQDWSKEHREASKNKVAPRSKAMKGLIAF